MEMKRFNLDEEYLRISKKYNISLKQVKEIYESQFNFARKAIGEGVHNEPETFKNINFIKLGKLHVKPRMLEHIKRTNQLKQQKQNEQERSTES